MARQAETSKCTADVEFKGDSGTTIKFCRRMGGGLCWADMCRERVDARSTRVVAGRCRADESARQQNNS